MEHEHVHEITNENERRTFIVIIFTVITMIAEIAYGYITKSMALLADGFHMGTHALALGLTFVAYILMRKYADSELFPNGTDKIGILTAYTSSLFLGFTGIWIIYEAVLRLINPVNIHFDEAILVALIGFIVNACCIVVMEGKHEHNEHEEDLNFKSAYYHIFADAITSVLAIIALLAGKYFNIVYFDSVIGVLGGILIIKWAWSLLKSTVVILTDMKKD